VLTHAEIVEILNREVYSASERLTEARGNVDAIIAEVPGGLPQPDGRHKITNESREHTKAMNALELALKRHSEFSFDGVIPRDLKKKPMGAADANQRMQQGKLPRASGEN